MPSSVSFPMRQLALVASLNQVDPLCEAFRPWAHDCGLSRCILVHPNGSVGFRLGDTGVGEGELGLILRSPEVPGAVAGFGTVGWSEPVERVGRPAEGPFETVLESPDSMRKVAGPFALSVSWVRLTLSWISSWYSYRAHPKDCLYPSFPSFRQH